jgi:hypothetical protein
VRRCIVWRGNCRACIWWHRRQMRVHRGSPRLRGAASVSR